MIDKNALLKKADDLNVMAAKLLPAPEGLHLYEQCYYRALVSLYREYHAGAMSIDQARADKRKLVDTYIDEAYTYDLSCEYADRLRVFQRYQHEIHKSGCPVCEKLNRALCGLETEVSNESTP